MDVWYSIIRIGGNVRRRSWRQIIQMKDFHFHFHQRKIGFSFHTWFQFAIFSYFQPFSLEQKHSTSDTSFAFSSLISFPSGSFLIATRSFFELRYNQSNRNTLYKLLNIPRQLTVEKGKSVWAGLVQILGRTWLFWFRFAVKLFSLGVRLSLKNVSWNSVNSSSILFPVSNCHLWNIFNLSIVMYQRPKKGK